MYVGGISRNDDQRALKKLFSECGNIVGVDLKGKFAFVEFETAQQAQKAIETMHGITHFGSKLSVEAPRK